jgi:hypothetical protein
MEREPAARSPREMLTPHSAAAGSRCWANKAKSYTQGASASPQRSASPDSRRSCAARSRSRACCSIMPAPSALAGRLWYDSSCAWSSAARACSCCSAAPRATSVEWCIWGQDGREGAQGGHIRRAQWWRGWRRAAVRRGQGMCHDVAFSWLADSGPTSPRPGVVVKPPYVSRVNPGPGPAPQASPRLRPASVRTSPGCARTLPASPPAPLPAAPPRARAARPRPAAAARPRARPAAGRGAFARGTRRPLSLLRAASASPKGKGAARGAGGCGEAWLKGASEHLQAFLLMR